MTPEVRAELDALLALLPHDDDTGDPDDVVALLGAQFEAGLAWPHLRRGCGGRALSPADSRAVREALREAGFPSSLAGFIGLHQVSALLHDVGRPEDAPRSLRRIFTGEDQWCQLFSEPGAGSDLANIATSAVRHGDAWVVNGQKVWTSNARHANLALLLARTDPGAHKHKGMTMLVLDMSAPGVEVRPLRQADGGARFSEVFLEDVQVPDANRLGEPGEGWALSMHVLGTERGGASDVFAGPMNALLDGYRARSSTLPASVRDEVISVWARSQVLALSGRRLRQTQQPKEAAALGGIAKVAASEQAQRLGTVLASVLGPDVLVAADYDAAFAEDLDPRTAVSKDFTALSPHRFVIRSRAMSIEGGTNEISRNIIGERVLGLAPDIRVDKHRPWREVAR